MSFPPDVILEPGFGKGGGRATSVSGVRVMNEREPTPKQLGELAHHHKLHKLNVHASLAGYLVSNGKLSDGSRYRITTNSGQTTLMLWPEGGEQSVLLDSYFFASPLVYDGTRPDWGLKPTGAWEFRGKTAAPTSAQFKSKRKIFEGAKTLQQPGNLTWFNPAFKIQGRPVVVSWQGRASRYGRMDWAGHGAQHSAGTLSPNLYSPGSTSGSFTSHRTDWASAYNSAVWINGVKHQVYQLAGDGVTQVPVPVMSAGMRHVTGAAAQLWVVSYEGGHQPPGTPQRLSVYMGTAGNPYTGAAIKAVKQFELDFWQGKIAGEFWEALLQPLYFNASCTKIAGLVGVPSNSTTNMAAAAAIAAGAQPTVTCAVLMQVDLATQTTTFDGSAGVTSDEMTVVYTGGPWTITSTHGGTLNEHRVTDWALHRVCYGAVDFAGDQLTVALVDHRIDIHYVEDGVWTGGTVVDPASASKTMTATTRTQYRVYRQHDNVTLAAKDSGVINTGSITATASGTGGASEPDRTGTGSGSRDETISADLYWYVTVEGGDLRHDWVVVGELVEVGTSTYADTFNNPSVPFPSLDPYARAPMMGLTSSSYPSYDILRNIAASGVKQRVPILRYAVAHAGAIVETGGYVLELARAGWSIFGLINTAQSPTGVRPPFSTADPDGHGAAAFWAWANLTNRGTRAADEFPYSLDPAPGPLVPPTWFQQLSPLVAVGNPYANTFAASTDGRYVFYNIGSSTRSASSPSAWTASGAFYIDGVRHDITASDYFPAQALSVLHSPIFIDNVPKE